MKPLAHVMRLLLFLWLVGQPFAAYAACAGGTLYYNSGNGLVEWCNGTQWYSAKAGAVGYTRIALTSGTTWTVPSDWNSSNNKIEAWGAGAGGGNGQSSNSAGGGAYASASNLTLTASSSVGITIGAGGTGGLASTNGTYDPGTSGGDTWLCNSTSG